MVGSVLGVVLVAAAILVTLLVTTGGEDGSTPDDAGASDQPSSSAPVSPSATSATSPTASTSSQPAPPSDPSSGPPASTPRPGPNTVVGTGYRYRLPNRAWSDLTAEAQRRNPEFAIDSFIVLGTAIETAQSNILVERSTAVGSPTLEELEPLWRANLSQADGAVPDDVPDITIDGERAIGVEFVDRQNQDGVSIDQVAYLVQHDGMQYSIGLSLPAEGDLVSRDDFGRVVASWRWDT